MLNEYKTCDICKEKTNCKFDLLLFGDWQESRDIVVHYFCLLLSTNLPQKGKDHSGINGFLVRDIRKEINAASKRLCCLCGRPHASIQCYKCKDYFHLRCGRNNRCLFTFYGDFRSYCDDCIPKTELQPAGLQSRPSSFERCSICREQMGIYNEVIFIFGKCCNKGYAHNVCVQTYALAAGYYLRCIWCRGKDFRDFVRLQGIFVPDRDARWELQKETYVDLHRGHNTCNMDICLCPKGRDYGKGNWPLILCSLCGSVGAHNPKCLLGKESANHPVSVFKCATCACIESSVKGNRQEKEVIRANSDDLIDRSIFMTKTNGNHKEQEETNFLPSFSEDDETQSTIIFVNQESNESNRNNQKEIPSGRESNVLPETNNASAEIVVQKAIETLVIEIDCSDEEPEQIEKLQQQNVIDIEDEDTQVFENSCSNTPKRKAAEETLLTQQPSTCDIGEGKVQLFDISTPDKHTAEKVTKAVTEGSTIQQSDLENTIKSTSIPSENCYEPTQEIPYTCSPDDSNQSPVVSSSSQAEKSEEWVTFEAYEYDEVEGKCIGNATMRINLREERFAGMTLEQIEENSSKMLDDGDKISRSDDVGIFAQIDAIIAEYTK